MKHVLSLITFLVLAQIETQPFLILYLIRKVLKE